MITGNLHDLKRTESPEGHHAIHQRLPTGAYTASTNSSVLITTCHVVLQKYKGGTAPKNAK